MRKAILGQRVATLVLLAVVALPTTALAAGGHGFSWFMMLPGGEHLYYMYAALSIAVMPAITFVLITVPPHGPTNIALREQIGSSEI